jgi:hypothetical protein
VLCITRLSISTLLLSSINANNINISLAMDRGRKNSRKTEKMESESYFPVL